MVYGAVATRAPPPSYRAHSVLQNESGPGALGPGTADDIEMATPSADGSKLSAFDGPRNVASAYDGSNPNPLNPMACFKQTTACIQQEQYLDPKYHGTGSTVAHMIHEKTGDKAMTKRILTTLCVAMVTSVVLIALFLVLAEFEGPVKEAPQAPIQSAPSSRQIAQKQRDMKMLLRGPGRVAAAFDKKWGKGTAAQAITSALKKKFQIKDIQKLLDDKSYAKKFNAKYGRGLGDSILAGRKKKAKASIAHKKAMLQRQRQQRVNDMRKGKGPAPIAGHASDTEKQEDRGQLEKLQRQQMIKKMEDAVIKSAAEPDNEDSWEEDGHDDDDED